MHVSAASQTPERWTRVHRSEWFRTGMIVLLLLVGRTSFANHYIVPSGSMQPTLQPGDRIAVNMAAYGITVPFTDFDLVSVGDPERGDVVVFDSPQDGTRLVKRVVAIGGDRVSVQMGHVSINGSPVGVAGTNDEEVLGVHHLHLDLSRGGGPDVVDWQIPAGKVLVMGDARGNSFDGRFFGLVPIGKIYGRATAVYYRSGQGLLWDSL